MKALLRAGLLAVVVLGMAPGLQAQGRVVVSHDEWFTGEGFFNANEKQFLANTLDWFGVGSGSSVLVYSGNGFLLNVPFQNWLTARGINVTNDANAASFATYDAVFTLGNPNLAATGGLLAAFVAGGGNVLSIGGAGIANEHISNNVFLSALGINMLPGYNGVGTVNTAAFAGQGPFGAALFTGVSSVYANNGNNLITAVPVAGYTTQVFYSGSDGVFAAVEGPGTNVVPEPATLLLLASGLVGVAAARRRRRSI